MKKYAYNLEVLDQWSPGLAYVLGLALTDGSVHKDLTRISFYSTDQQLLEVVFSQHVPLFPIANQENILVRIAAI